MRHQLNKMDRNDSYKYVFYEILKFVDKVEIIYQHEALATTYGSEEQLDGGSQWCLSLISICGIEEYDSFKKELERNINSKINYIRENRLDLYGLYDYFIEQLEERRERFENLQKGELKLEDLIEEGIILLNYIGYLPLSQHYDLIWLGIKGEPSKSDFDENSFDNLYQITKNYFEVMIQGLTKLILFLKHELNLSITQKQQLKNQKGKNEFIKLLKVGEIEQLFIELDSTEEYQNDEEIILLSARYFTLEKDKNRGIINRDDYNIQSAKLVSSLIKAMLKN
mgnify:CR=1 FL=1